MSSLRRRLPHHSDYQWFDHGASPWRICILLLVWSALLLGRHAHAVLLETETLWDGAAPELAIVSIILNGRDLHRDVVAAFAPDDREETYVDLREFVQALDLELRQEGDEYLVLTPIGEAAFGRHLLRRLDQNQMIALDVLGRGLASEVSFSQREYAVVVDVPWSLSKAPADAEVIRPGDAIQANVDAPTVSLSFLRTEFLQRIEQGSDTSNIITDTGGRLFDGFWQVRVRDYLENDPLIEDYVWLQSGRSHRLLLGNQTVSLDPLLRGFEFTGAQAAWTNQPIELFTDSLQPDQLITNQRGSIRNYVGQGPPGGRAQLRIEGVPVAETIIALDGRYEFRDVEVPAGNVVQVEAWLFERGAGGVPVDIQDFSGYNTNRVLPRGTLLVQGGFGVDGNAIEDTRGNLDAAGFAGARYAPLDGLTVESIYQRVGGRDAALTSASVNLDRFGFVSGQIAYTGGQQAWRLEAENRQPHVFWRGFIQHQPDDWFGREGDLDDVFAEVGYRFNPQWRLSLVGRDFSSDDEAFDYLLPAVEWRPSNDIILRLRPDFDGDYSGQGFWRVNRRNTISAVVNEQESSLQWLYDLEGRDSFMLQALDRDNLGQRYAAVFRRGSGGLRSLGWGLGLLAGEGSVGYLAQADYEFIPGLRGRLEAFRDPFSGVLGAADTVVTLSVIADFNVSGGRLARGGFRRELLDRGTISGSIEVPENVDSDFNLSGVAIMLDNQVRTRTEDGGRFTIPYLQPGIYRLRLDLDGLPLELQPREDAFWVEVAAGAASFVTFSTDVLLGFAGQLSATDGCPLGDTALEVIDAQGNSLQQTRSNAFGYYRVDNLAPGQYTVRLADNEQVTLGVTLRGDFLFNQDIIAPVTIGCEQEAK